MSSKDTTDTTDLMEMDLPLDLKGEEVLDFPDGGDEDKWEFDPASHKIRYEGIVVTRTKDDEGSHLSQLRKKIRLVLNLPFDFFWKAPWITPVPRYPSGIRRPLQPTNGVRVGPRRITTRKKNATPRSIAGPSATRDFPEPVDSVPVIQVPFAPIDEGDHMDLHDVDVHVGATDDIPRSPIIPDFARTSPPPLPMFSPLPAPTFPVWKPMHESRRVGSFSGAREVIYISSDEEIDDEDDPEESPSYYYY